MKTSLERLVPGRGSVSRVPGADAVPWLGGIREVTISHA